MSEDLSAPATSVSSRDRATQARRWWTLSVLSLAQLMVLLDATIINIALPRAQIDLHFSSGNRQWIVTAYALSFGSLLLLGGRLSDLWGRRSALHVGLAGFALASALGGSAHSFATLVTARAIQGAFGALLAPAALAALSVTFREPKERAKAFAIYGVIGGSGAAIGLLLGGALTEWASWRWCLYINLFFAALAIVGVSVFVKGGRSEHHSRLDVLGTMLATEGLFCVVFGFSHAVTASWSSDVTWGSLVLGVALLVLFVLWQSHSKHPLLPLRIVTNRTRAGALISLLLTNMGIYALFLFLAYYLEETLGFSPMRAGLAFLPIVVAISLSASFASARLLARTGPRPLVTTGMLLSTMGMVLFTRLTLSSDYAGHVLPGLIVLGLGLGLIFSPAMASATAAVGNRDAGAASALVNTSQQIGGSIGTALLNTIAVTVTMRALTHAKGGGVAASRAANLHGFSVAFWWAAGFFGAGAIISLVMLESGSLAPEGDLLPAT
ncbi:MAG: putative transporter [Acidimicrobiaceae bacterium]|nr:putative transporter [Acidimicrobiaceae bacterium]